MNMVGIMKQVTHSLDRFHPVLLCLKDLSAISTWAQGFNIMQQQKAQSKVNTKVSAKVSVKGKGSKGTKGGKGARGTGAKANNKIVQQAMVTRGRGRGGKGSVQQVDTGRVAGSSGKGGKKGKGKGGKTTVADGLTRKYVFFFFFKTKVNT